MGMFNFDSIKRSLGDYSSNLRKVREEIEKIEREIEETMLAPLDRRDADEALLSWVEAEGGKYREELAAQFARLPAAVLAHTDGSKLASVLNTKPITTLAVPLEGGAVVANLTPVAHQRLLCGLFPDLILEVMRGELDRRKWEPGAIRQVEKEKRVLQLEGKLKDLKEQEAKMVQIADSLGVSVERVG